VHRKNVAFQNRIGVYPGSIGEQKSLGEASLTFQIGGHAQSVNGLIQFELDRSLRAQEGLIIELDPVVLGSPKLQGKDIGRPIELGIDFKGFRFRDGKGVTLAEVGLSRDRDTKSVVP